MNEKILITSALPYANGPLHFGHLIGAYLPADSYARFERMQGNDVLFICGSDEYGVAITLNAEIAGKTPKQYVDHFHSLNKGLFDKLHISFDHYSRTTSKEHAPLVQEFFLDLLKAGFIEERVTKQLYSPLEQRFLADRYVVGECPKCHHLEARGDECPKCGASYEATDLINPRSKIKNSPLILKDTKNWFLLVDKFKQELSEWIKKRGWKPNVVNFILPYIEDLRPRAITRDLDWGIPVPLPDAEGKVLYVWFDAPIGYLSIAKEWAIARGQPDLWKEYWENKETKLVQFIGKDNIVFHAVIFPAMIMGQKHPYKLVDELPANEFLNLEGKQFSKSSGWYISMEEFLTKFSADQLRYALAANAPETQDAEFTWDDFQIRVNSELIGKFANFVHRVLSFVYTRMEAKVPEMKDLDEDDQAFLAGLEGLAKEMKNNYSNFRLRKATQSLMEMSALSNGYFDKKQPWKSSGERLETTMAICLEAVKTLALVSFPLIPSSAEKIWKMLGFSSSLETILWEDVLKSSLQPGHCLVKPEPLFSKIEDTVIAEEKQKLYGHKPDRVYPALKEEVAIEDFGKMDLRVAKILKAEKIAKSKKLLHLTVDLGFETRPIVSGIGEHYTNPEELIGKQVVIIANLKPATIMGHVSQGMLLAASFESSLKLPSVDEAILPGSKIT
ncbi:MAG: methionine--tRNA ligase [Chlamydiae bacterium]|nr:methionine--tRNA ligase [Chlamydiota bacterium]